MTHWLQISYLQRKFEVKLGHERSSNIWKSEKARFLQYLIHFFWNNGHKILQKYLFFYLENMVMLVPDQIIVMVVERVVKFDV